jgi:hypothetical protein
MFYVGIVGLIFISLFYWLKNKELRGFFLFWYLIFLPTSKLLPEDLINLPGFRFEVLFGLGFLALDLFTERANAFSSKIIWKKIKPAIILYVLQMVYVLYETLKAIINPVSLYKTQEISFPIFLIRNLIFLVIFLRICFLLQDEYFRKIVILAITMGFVLLGISSFFSELFTAMGMKIGGSFVFDPTLGHRVFRSAGLYRGDPTQFSAFLSTGFGLAFALFLLSKTKVQRIYLFLVLGACFIGNLNTGTRAGFLGMIAVVIFYLLVEKQSFSKKSLIIFVIIVSGVWMLINFGEFFLARVSRTDEQLAGADNALSRTATWVAHIYYFLNHPQWWFTGTWERVRVGPVILASHSTVLKYLVYAGLPFFIFYYKNIIKIFSTYFKSRDKFSFNFLYPLLGYLVPSLMNDNFDIAYLPLMIALGMFNPKREKLSFLFSKIFSNKNKITADQKVLQPNIESEKY